MESGHIFAAIRQLKGAKSAARLNRHEGGEPPVRFVEVDLRRDVDVGNAIAVRHAERSIKQVPHTLEPAAGHASLTSINTRDAPRFRVAWLNFHLVVLQVEYNVGVAQAEVCEVLLDHLALVAETYDEVVDPVR